MPMAQRTLQVYERVMTIFGSVERGIKKTICTVIAVRISINSLVRPAVFECCEKLVGGLNFSTVGVLPKWKCKSYV